MPENMPNAARRPILALFIAYCSPAMPIRCGDLRWFQFSGQMMANTLQDRRFGRLNHRQLFYGAGLTVFPIAPSHRQVLFEKPPTGGFFFRATCTFDVACW